MIRLLRREDIDKLMPLIKDFHYAIKAKRYALFEDSEMSWREWLGQCVDNDGLMCAVLEEGTEFIGFITAVQTSAFWNPSIRIACETSLWVSESKRGQGLGTLLIKALEEWARVINADIVSAGSSSRLFPKQAGKLLRSQGFELEEKLYSKRVS